MPNDTRICQMGELVVRDATGHSRAFRIGERVEMTPALVEALGEYISGFVPIDDATVGALDSQLDPAVPLEPFTTAAADPGVTLPPGTVTALVPPAHEE
jgi:hypothetical protein